jgi:hypothetical protein
LGGGEGGRRSGNMGAAGFGATVSGAPPPQTIVWWWGAGGTMEGPLEEANLVQADSTRLDSGQLEAKSTTNRRKIRFEVAGQVEPSLPIRLSSPVSEPLGTNS